MSKEEVVKMMLESFLSDNRMMAQGSGMPEDELEKMEEKSRPSIEYMLGNVYDLLVTKQLIN
jgi:hypothetical protein